MRISHVAMTVPAALLAPPALGEWLEFYEHVFGWRADDALSIPARRIFLSAPTRESYLTIRAADVPMVTSGYEHVGIWVDAEPELRAIHARAREERGRRSDVEVSEIEESYEGRLLSFRARFRLPLTLEVQHLRAGRD